MTRATPQDVAFDTDRTIGDLLRVGIIISVDLDAGQAVVSFGDEETPPIDWLMAVGDTTIWLPPTAGQQVLVLAPEGDVEQAVILNGLPSSTFAPLFLGLKNAIRFKDGTFVSCNPETNRLDIEAAGTINLVAPDGLTITGKTSIMGDVTITGDVAVTGVARAEQDVIGGGKSLKTHRHTGVAAGGAVSGPPQ